MTDTLVPQNYPEILIEIVKGHPILYDLRHPDYKNIRKKDEIWEEIGVNLKVDPNELKKRWKNLRDCYAKILRSSKNSTSKQTRKFRPWQYSAKMEFLREHFAFAKSVSNLSKDYENTEGSDSDAKETANPSTSRTLVRSPDIVPARSSTSSNSSSTSSKRDRRKSGDSDINQIMNYLSKQKQPRTYSATEYLMLGLAKTIDALSPEEQITCKLNVVQTVLKHEMAEHTRKTAAANKKSP